jgi:MYXO-CTERM domain-containing protein
MFSKAIFLIATVFSSTALADGACCNPDEEFCIYTAEEFCLDSGGTYYGDGVDCSADVVECLVEDSSMSSTTDPDDPELGACCVDDTCINAITEDDCKHELGTWYGSMGCDELGAECEGDPDPDHGACCLDADADGVAECVDAVSNDWCSDNAGIFYVGMDCGAVGAECQGEPEPDLGACCVDVDGIAECVDATTNDWCSHNLGTWYAAMDCGAVGAECESDPEPDLGACCREDTCIDNVPEDQCKDVGTWYPGASCDDLVAECGLVDEDEGACCLDDECIETTAEECWADEGAFYGPGSTCDDAFVECCGGDTGTTGPVEPVPGVSCSSAGGSRGGLHLMLPLALLGMAAGFRRREVR